MLAINPHPANYADIWSLIQEKPFTEISFMTRLRFRQIRLFSKFFVLLAQLPGTAAPLSLLGSSSALSWLLVGFRQTYQSFEAAEHAAAAYHVPSHEHPGSVVTHLSLAEAARPSDYPVLFHLQKIAPTITSILDIGGSGGNLFYSYAHLLDLAPTIEWTVFEVPKTVLAGRKIAALRDERRLFFTDDLSTCRTADTVIISGSLHYFETLPPDLIATIETAPTHIFINRTPVIDGPTTVTIQDANLYYAMSPARMLNRQVLLDSMAAANYDLVDQWLAPELKLNIPLHPELSATAYSGFYFRRRPESSTAN